MILLAAIVADSRQRHDLVAGRTELREPQARDEARKAERLHKARRELVFNRLVRLDTAVDPAVCDYLLAVYSRLNPLHPGNWATIGSGTFPNLRRDGIHPSSGYKFLMASGIPDHKVTWLGTLRHLPVVHRATRSDPVFQFGDVLWVAIHLKYVNFNQGAFQVQMYACRDATSPNRRQRSLQPGKERLWRQQSSYSPGRRWLRPSLGPPMCRPRAEPRAYPGLPTLSADSDTLSANDACIQLLVCLPSRRPAVISAPHGVVADCSPTALLASTRVHTGSIYVWRQDRRLRRIRSVCGSTAGIR
jgi:hypothetical protein